VLTITGENYYICEHKFILIALTLLFQFASWGRSYHAYKREIARHSIFTAIFMTNAPALVTCDVYRTQWRFVVLYLPVLTGCCAHNVDEPLSVEASLHCCPPHSHSLYRCGFRDVIIREFCNIFLLLSLYAYKWLRHCRRDRLCIMYTCKVWIVLTGLRSWQIWPLVSKGVPQWQRHN
jgi:hypothetical protein